MPSFMQFSLRLLASVSHLAVKRNSDSVLSPSLEVQKLFHLVDTKMTAIFPFPEPASSSHPFFSYTKKEPWLGSCIQTFLFHLTTISNAIGTLFVKSKYQNSLSLPLDSQLMIPERCWLLISKLEDSWTCTMSQTRWWVSSQPQAKNTEEVSAETVYLERKKVARHKSSVKENLNFFTYIQEMLRNMVKCKKYDTISYEFAQMAFENNQ